MLGIIKYDLHMKQIGFLLWFCLCFTRCLASDNVDSLYIRYFSWDNSKQPHIITCTNFEYELPYTEFRISDQSTICKLLNSMNKLHKTSETDFSVGCKVFFLHRNKVVKTVCLNSKYILINGSTYYCTKDLMNCIDDMMRHGAMVDINKRYISGKYGDEYHLGREVLFSKLETYLSRTVPEMITNSKDTRIVVHCKSNKKGKTTQAEIQVYNEELSTSQKKVLEQQIYKFFMRKIKWMPDETRMKSDWISMMYKIKRKNISGVDSE